jgi:tetratricopeptide (TPR) repeat protein
VHAESIEPREDALEAPSVPHVSGTARDPGPLSRLVARAAELARHGRATAAYEVVEPELAREGGHAPIEQRAALMIEASAILWMLGRFEESESRARRGLTLAEQGGDAHQAAEALLRHGLALHRRGQLDAAREAYEEAGARFRRLGEIDRAAAATNNRASCARTAASGCRAHALRGGGRGRASLGIVRVLDPAAEPACSNSRPLWGHAARSRRHEGEEAKDRRVLMANLVARGTLAARALARGRARADVRRSSRARRAPCRARRSSPQLRRRRARRRRPAVRTHHFKRAQRLRRRPRPTSPRGVARLVVKIAEAPRRPAARSTPRADRGTPGQTGSSPRRSSASRRSGPRAVDETVARGLLADVAGVFAEMGERFERGRTLAPSRHRARCRGGDPVDRASACFAEAGAEAELHRVEQAITARPPPGRATPPALPAPARPERLANVGPSRSPRVSARGRVRRADFLVARRRARRRQGAGRAAPARAAGAPTTVRRRVLRRRSPERIMATCSATCAMYAAA